MSTFDYRRRLDGDDWKQIGGMAAGAGLAVAAVVVYFGRLWLQRVPLERREVIDTLDSEGHRVSRPVEAIPDSDPGA